LIVKSARHSPQNGAADSNTQQADSAPDPVGCVADANETQEHQAEREEFREDFGPGRVGFH